MNPSSPIDVKVPSTSGDRKAEDRRKFMIPQEEKRSKELPKMTQVGAVNISFVFTFSSIAISFLCPLFHCFCLKKMSNFK